jgi:hypothetical protein
MGSFDANVVGSPEQATTCIRPRPGAAPSPTTPPWLCCRRSHPGRGRSPDPLILGRARKSDRAVTRRRTGYLVAELWDGIAEIDDGILQWELALVRATGQKPIQVGGVVVPHHCRPTDLLGHQLA